MSSRVTRRGTCLLPVSVAKTEISQNVDSEPATQRSMRSKKRGHEPNVQPNLSEDQRRGRPLTVLQEVGECQINGKTSRNTRSRKDAANNLPHETVAIKKKHHEKENRAVVFDEESAIQKSKVPVKIIERKSSRRNKNHRDSTSETNKENAVEQSVVVIKKKSKRNKKISDGSFSLDFDKSDRIESTVLPSRGGSAYEKSVLNTSAPRTRRGAKKTQPEPVSNDLNKPNRSKRNKKKSDCDEKNYSKEFQKNNISTTSIETIYHSIDGGASINKDDFSFSSVKELSVSDSKNISLSKRSTKKSLSSDKKISQFLDESYPALVDDSITSEGESNTMEFMAKSKNNIRISGIEEFPTKINVKNGLKREGTYNKELQEISEDKPVTRRHVFSAASPCRLFSRQTSLPSDKSHINPMDMTLIRTPPKLSCRAISVGSAGRTPMPPPVSEEIYAIVEKSTPLKRPQLNVTHSLEKPVKPASLNITHSIEKSKSGSLNVTHSIEKPSKSGSLNVTRSIEKPKKLTSLNVTHSLKKSKQSAILPIASVTKTKTKVGFRKLEKLESSHLPQKSNLKGSNKNLVSSNSATKPGTRKRSFTETDADARGGKIRKMTNKEQNVNNGRLMKPKTPMSAGKHLYSSKANSTLVNTTPVKGIKPAAPVSRNKMPDFALLHKKQFEQMESLVQNKARKEERARDLLFSKTLPDGLRSTSKNIGEGKPKGFVFSKAPIELGFTRFGFKLHTTQQPSNAKNSPLPSKAKPVTKGDARKAVMREETLSVVEKKRLENRNYVRGVRTNRRFELQMQARNLPV